MSHPHPRNAQHGAAYVQRIRDAGGKRTTVELTAAAVAAIEALRTLHGHRSTSETICHALGIAQAQHNAAQTMRTITRLGTPK